MLLAIPYVRHAKHPRAKLVAAYMVFAILFSVGSIVMYSVLLVLLGRYIGLGFLQHPLGAVIFLTLVFVPAFLLARWQLKKPPRQVPLD
jgi:energy-coupling factor transporter transmembrane protein EcfT